MATGIVYQGSDSYQPLKLRTGCVRGISDSGEQETGGVGGISSSNSEYPEIRRKSTNIAISSVLRRSA